MVSHVTFEILLTPPATPTSSLCGHLGGLSVNYIRVVLSMHRVNKTGHRIYTTMHSESNCKMFPIKRLQNSDNNSCHFITCCMPVRDESLLFVVMSFLLAAQTDRPHSDEWENLRFCQITWFGLNTVVLSSSLKKWNIKDGHSWIKNQHPSSIIVYTVFNIS